MSFVETNEMTDYVKIIMESGDSIVVHLNNPNAPITTENFKNLVKEGFYNGLIFHRVIKGFMIQGGDPTGTGCGGSEKEIKGEFMANGVKNTQSHKRGVISMARTNMPNSASSQFFICHEDATFLDGQYASFGEVVEGIETVDKIANEKTNYSDKPLNEQKMAKVVFVK